MEEAAEAAESPLPVYAGYISSSTAACLGLRLPRAPPASAASTMSREIGRLPKVGNLPSKTAFQVFYVEWLTTNYKVTKPYLGISPQPWIVSAASATPFPRLNCTHKEANAEAPEVHPQLRSEKINITDSQFQLSTANRVQYK